MELVKPKSPTVLVVDDSPTNVKVLADALSDEYRVKVAVNGPEALKVCQSEHKPDLILLDVMMPVMDGYEVIRRLKQNPATRKIPVIFVTAKATDVDEETGLRLGAVDYITKPISLAITKARVRSHLALKLQADMLEELSLIDSLTKIPNRRKLDEALQADWQKMAGETGGALSLLMIDIDSFKDYNDHYGHGAGDECLRRVAKALAESLTLPDGLVARYGGEEFAVVLPHTRRTPALRIAEALRQSILDLQIPHEFSIAGQVISLSIGCATAENFNATASPNELLQQADSMLYQAKQHGRNQVYSA